MVKQRFSVIASREGYQGEQLQIHKIENNAVYMTVGNERKWYKISYEIVQDGIYNQSVRKIRLPYIVYKKDVYSLDSFHDWMDRR